MFWIAALILGALCLVVALRCFGVKRVRVAGRELPLERPRGLAGERFTLRMGLAAVAWGVAVLAALWMVSAVYCMFTRNSVSWGELYKLWTHADAAHYRALAEQGYWNYTDGDHLLLVFFPLYPWLTHLLAQLLPNYDLCGHLLSGLCFVASCYLLARLTTEEFGWRAGALALALFSACPYAFFFAAYYTESLFVLLSLAAFYMIRRRRYLAAGIVGALAAMTRMQGLLLVPVAVAEWISSERPVEKLRARDWPALRRDLLRLAGVALMGLGVAVYLWLNYAVEGDPFRFLVYQKGNWSQGFVPLPRCVQIIWEYVKAEAVSERGFNIWIPELCAFLACMAAAVYGARRVPVSWMTYFLLALMMNYSLSWPLSCGRYMASAFPLPVILAVALRKRPLLGYLLVLTGTLFQGIFLIAFLSGNSIY